MYPVTFSMDYGVQRSRATTFFRWILAIPHLVFAYIYRIVFFFALVASWFALLFTGRWPQGLFEFNCQFQRYMARLTAYLFLGTDAYPPFNGGEDDSYPVRVHFAPPLPSYSRLKVLFRGVYVILAWVIRYALSIVISFVAVLSWVVIVVTGRQPAALQNALRFSLSYTVRADALIFLITETYPPLDDIGPVTVAIGAT